MGLFTRMVNGLYSLGRGIEGFSVMIGAGAFNNTDRGLCRECFMANKPDVELCTDCRIHWVCTMDPPDAMYHSTQTTLAVAALALGQSVFWINDTMNPSAFMKKGCGDALRFLFSKNPPKKIANAIPRPISISHFDFYLLIIFIVSVLLLVMITMLITFVGQTRERGSLRSQASSALMARFVMGGFLAAWAFFGLYLDLPPHEFAGIVMPHLLGCAGLIHAVLRKMRTAVSSGDEEKGKMKFRMG